GPGNRQSHRSATLSRTRSRRADRHCRSAPAARRPAREPTGSARRSAHLGRSEEPSAYRTLAGGAKIQRNVRAMLLERQNEPLRAAAVPDPRSEDGQLLLKISACAVCRTDLHLRDHEIEATKLPVILGHQIVGRTQDGRRVGVPWLGWTDGTCRY